MLVRKLITSTQSEPFWTSDEVDNFDVAKSVVIPAGHLQVKFVVIVTGGAGTRPDARRCKKHAEIIHV
jgi:hypothetical protein